MLRLLLSLVVLSAALEMASGMPISVARARTGGLAQSLPSHEPAHDLEIAARKGTRTYQPGDAAPAAPMATDGERQSTPPAGTDAHDNCMALWDADTHMTKDEWRESCKRVIKERASQPDT